MTYPIRHLAGFSPGRIKFCTMIEKGERREVAVKVDDARKTVGEGFLVGYGLYFADYFGNLLEIYHMKL